jgi:hypothetical protein
MGLGCGRIILSTPSDRRPRNTLSLIGRRLAGSVSIADLYSNEQTLRRGVTIIVLAACGVRAGSGGAITRIKDRNRVDDHVVARAPLELPDGGSQNDNDSRYWKEAFSNENRGWHFKFGT